ncbi:MlaD family protein [Rhodococcus oxybenzonivorans]|uniref:MCE family protein n=1 Tax=Rhodococcus TaxID=1827 RepID=UPI00131FF0C9|nr:MULTISPECIES: MlaD family protein [Rhodococcus]MDV7354227.1 MlaD family protein [Rhodococcus oxybenzonivorans]QHE67537.1 MCE family protein of Mce F Subgroup [Rhodococcus sp. WAY2]
MRKFVRIQLIIFSILTVIGLVVMSIQYVKVPVMFGIGRYDVVVQLPSTGGLYSHANVAYRGTNVGVVDRVVLTDDGVEAQLSLDSSYKIPADVDAVVKSVSAIGEQYVDLIPRTSEGPDLADGDVIPRDRSAVPQDVGEMLDQADALLASISDTRLQTVIDEAFTAFNGSGPDLQRLIDSARLFVEEADANSDETIDLIEQIGPLLDTQTVSSDAIRSWTQDLVTFTDQLRASDADIRGVLEKGPGTAVEATQLFQELQPTLPILLSNLVSVGQVGVIYNKSIEQVLVIYPPLTAALVTAAKGGPVEDGAIVDFALELHDPPACTTGFLPADQRRTGDQTEPIATPNDLYCKAAQDDPSVVRGARNLPCMEYPGRRAPTVQACRDGWEAAGNNPPYGPIMPPDVPSYTAVPVIPSSYEGSPSGPVAAVPYDPGTGSFVGSDGKTYTQPDLASGSPRKDSTWQTMMTGQQI